MSLLLSLQCQGVGGIIIVTIVTSFMLIYHSSGDRLSSLMSRHTAEPVPSKKQPKRAFTLEGYTRVLDHKVNEHHPFVPFDFHKVQIEFVRRRKVNAQPLGSCRSLRGGWRGFWLWPGLGMKWKDLTQTQLRKLEKHFHEDLWPVDTQHRSAVLYAHLHIVMVIVTGGTAGLW